MNHTPMQGLIKSVENCLKNGGAAEFDIEFVKTAVNAHDDLINALKRAWDLLDNAFLENERGEKRKASSGKTGNIIKQALEKAGVKS